MNLVEHLRLPPGPVDLTQWATDEAHGFDGSKDDGKDALAELGADLADLQERLFAEGRTEGSRSVLLVGLVLMTSAQVGITALDTRKAEPRWAVAVAGFCTSP